MSREIKFRAWFEERKRFLDTDEWYMGALGSKYLSYAVKPYNKNDIIVEQYTGLRDKNGKEIYEGDIMRYDAIDYKVLWADYYAGFETKRLNSPWNNAGLTLHFLASVGRVIGNIHENPELLGGEK